MLAETLMEVFKASAPRLSLSPFMAQDFVGAVAAGYREPSSCLYRSIARPCWAASVCLCFHPGTSCT